MLKPPAAPLVAGPVVSTMDPLDPDADAPVLKDSAPLTPDTPEPRVLRVNAPLDVTEPRPAASDNEPPVAVVLSPPTKLMRPPESVSPLPTTTLILPLVPLVADPVRIITEPLLPFDVVPDLNDNPPLTPDTPASAVTKLNVPLLVAVPNPVVKDTAPPVTVVLSPPTKLMRPPE